MWDVCSSYIDSNSLLILNSVAVECTKLKTCALSLDPDSAAELLNSTLIETYASAVQGNSSLNENASVELKASENNEKTYSLRSI